MSSFAEWVGAQDLRDAAMGLDDPSLEDRTASLERRYEQLLATSERLDDAVAAATRALAETRGIGESESGAVKVTVDAHNRVVDISLTQRAMRLGSPDRLRRALLAACDAAVADAAASVARATGLADHEGPVVGLLDEMPEIAAVLPAAFRERTPSAAADEEKTRD